MNKHPRETSWEVRRSDRDGPKRRGMRPEKTGQCWTLARTKRYWLRMISEREKCIEFLAGDSFAVARPTVIFLRNPRENDNAWRIRAIQNASQLQCAVSRLTTVVVQGQNGFLKIFNIIKKKRENSVAPMDNDVVRAWRCSVVNSVHSRMDEGGWWLSN